MGNINLDLDFEEDLKSEQPHPPRAHVQVKFSTGDGFITQTCMTFSEFKGEVDRLIGELESIRSRGRSKFADSLKRAVHINQSIS
jgi:hypothetical protein